ncbi:MAG: 4Fe-4S ferredoxin, iron-sulfur binding protein, partial [Proteobacteria bacterium]|nr:4Fe-4S ferredoxin, iron-sulfur binding protein [Pseudomonadota bacterium]
MPSTDYSLLLVYLTLFLVFSAYYLRRRTRSQAHNLAILDQARSAGYVEPASLHPKIDYLRCIGCGSCAKACPEQNVLGIIDGKAHMLDPSHCIGHGACRTACPVDAITLVFGSEKRGVDIPFVQPNFETNVPGIFIAGELGGMGLIRNAITQGRQALEAIAKQSGKNPADVLDVMIVGAGPAGFSASLAALERKLRFVTVEQDSLGGTVAHYPRGKVVMTAPVQLPIIGKVKIGETSKEALLAFWEKVASQSGVSINYQERVESVTRDAERFLVKTTRNTYQTRALLLAIGRRGTPRTLDVPGEELSKVVYRLIDPEQYRGQHVLVVGGGDSALEAACSIADEEGSTVSLSYRSESFSRAKDKNRARVAAAEEAGRLRVLYRSQVKSITSDRVLIEQDSVLMPLRNDAVIVSAGGVLPTAFLKDMG